MKIIAQAPSDWTMQLMCTKCETQLEAEKSDVLYGDFYSGMDEEKSMDYYVICPVCKVIIFLEVKKLPKHVQFAAQKLFEDNGRKKVTP